MVTLGCDSHKRSHTVVAVNQNGRLLARRIVPASPAGHLEALGWAERWPRRRWALENCRPVCRRLESDLLVAGEVVVRVSPGLAGEARRRGRERGKSDAIDAQAVARAALREPDLPTARLEGREREARLLVGHRERLVGQRTQLQNQLRWHLHELDPEFKVAPRALDRQRVLAAVRARLEELQPGLVARLAGELVEQIGDLTERINRLEGEISELVGELAPSLLELPGCAALTAAKAVGETADVSRFRSAPAYARNNGSAPIPASSGNQQRVRLNRGGNRQLNAALHRIAITQIRLPGRGRAYFERQLAAGHTKAEALRSLRRRISDEVYRRLRQDQLARLARAQASAA